VGRRRTVVAKESLRSRCDGCETPSFRLVERERPPSFDREWSARILDVEREVRWSVPWSRRRRRGRAPSAAKSG